MPRLKPNAKGVFRRSKSKQHAKGPRIATITILTIVGFVCSSLWLASITTLPEVTRASGELRPMGGYRQVQSSEGGVVFDVFVTEGQTVEENHVLAILQSTPLNDSIRDTQEKIRSIIIELSNLKAMRGALDDVELPLQVVVERLNSDGFDYAASKLVILVEQDKAQNEIVDQLQRALTVQQEASLLMVKRIEARKLRFARVKSLQSRQLVPMRDLDDQRDSLDQLLATQVDVQVRLSETLKELTAAKAVINQGRLDLRDALIPEIFRLDQELNALSVNEDALLKRRLALEIKAPEPGVIHAIAFPNEGELIAPGETIFELLPTMSQLIAEVEFDPVDIGHIADGDAVILKFDTFDPRRYGDVSGLIKSISPNLVVDPNSAREFFRATVVLDNNTIGDGVWLRNLRAGMVATVEVITAERTVMAYMLKPIVRSLDRAFVER
jgi:HlyD family type I secretion membrane fusion protein